MPWKRTAEIPSRTLFLNKNSTRHCLSLFHCSTWRRRLGCFLSLRLGKETHFLVLVLDFDLTALPSATASCMMVVQNFVVDLNKALVFQVGHLGEAYEEWVHQPIVSKEGPRFFENEILEFLTRTVWWAIPVIWLPVFWNLVKLMATTSTAPALFGGGLLGYVMYDCTHYYLHHGQPRTEVPRNLKKYHLNHHFRIQDKGFGITSSLWDKVFGTLPPKMDAKSYYDNPRDESGDFKMIWRYEGPQRVCLFLWKLMHGRLLPNEERIRRHMTNDSARIHYAHSVIVKTS
ncbi:hypothetical protein JHK87_042153 [Glycine soja]|nr:hypothetical protein JHK87_042153 [Glycine soja]